MTRRFGGGGGPPIVVIESLQLALHSTCTVLMLKKQ